MCFLKEIFAYTSHYILAFLALKFVQYFFRSGEFLNFLVRNNFNYNNIEESWNAKIKFLYVLKYIFPQSLYPKLD